MKSASGAVSIPVAKPGTSIAAPAMAAQAANGQILYNSVLVSGTKAVLRSSRRRLR